MLAFGIESFPTRRCTAALLVVLLHVALIALLLRTLQTHPPSQIRGRERDYWITLQVQPKAQPAKKPPASSRMRAVAPPHLPDYRSVALPPVTEEANPSGLHLFLFDCAPENFATLTQEQRAQCARAMPKPGDSVDYADHSDRSHDAAHWARGLARKQSPTLLPCASPQGIGIGLGTFACLAKGLASGFDLDDTVGYGGGPPLEAHVPNNGDPPPPPPYNMRH
jgi:hypothetical protein